jgi:Trypsin
MRGRVLTAVAAAALAAAATAGAVTGGNLDGSAHPAVGLLLADRGNGPVPDCSGALVAPTVFLTAAHCVVDLPSARVWVTFDSRYVPGTSTLLAGTAHGDTQYGHDSADLHDVAVVVLDQPVQGITPMTLPAAGALDAQRLKSATFTNVGYGYYARQTGGGQPQFLYDGYRRVSTSTFDSLTATLVHLAEKPGGVCYGDSGGPRLLGSTIVAVTSSGATSCAGPSISYRVDTPSARAFLAPFVALP